MPSISAICEPVSPEPLQEFSPTINRMKVAKPTWLWLEQSQRPFELTLREVHENMLVKNTNMGKTLRSQ